MGISLTGLKSRMPWVIFNINAIEWKGILQFDNLTNDFIKSYCG